MMISKKMADKLNLQVKYEFESYWIYLAMAFSFETMGLKGFANWFYAQADEEKEHAMKIAKYILDQGAEVKVDHEIKITKDINNLVALARTEKDYATETFLHWFVNEQVEEVASTTEVLNMVEMAPTPKHLFMLENHLSRSEE